MKKHHLLRTVLLSAVFALLTLVLLTPAASAHTAAPAHAAATSLAPASVPDVNIVIRHGKAVFILNCVLIYNAKMREQGHGTDEIRIGRKAH